MVDQPTNAELIIDAGAGIMLCNKIRYTSEVSEQLTYSKPEFDSEKVLEVGVHRNSNKQKILRSNKQTESSSLNSRRS